MMLFQRRLPLDNGANRAAFNGLEDYKLPEDSNRRAAEARTTTVEQTPVAAKGTPFYQHKDHMDRMFGM